MNAHQVFMDEIAKIAAEKKELDPLFAVKGAINIVKPFAEGMVQIYGPPAKGMAKYFGVDKLMKRPTKELIEAVEPSLSRAKEWASTPEKK